MSREAAALLRRVRKQLPIGSLGWVLLCRATDYVDWQDGESHYYPAGPPTKTRYAARLANWLERGGAAWLVLWAGLALGCAASLVCWGVLCT